MTNFPVVASNLIAQNLHLVDSADLFGTASETAVFGTAFNDLLFKDMPANFRLRINSLSLLVNTNGAYKIDWSYPWSAAQQLGKGRLYGVVPSTSTDTVKKIDFNVGTGGILLPPNQRITIGYAGVITGVSAVVTGNFQVEPVDNDYSCKNQMVIIGDSISWTLGGSSTLPSASGFGTLHFEYWMQKAQYYLQTPLAYGKINSNIMSFGGSNSRTMLYTLYQDGGVLQSGLTIISLGMNDCASGIISTAEYTANIQEIVNMARASNPNGTILLCAPSPTNDPLRTPFIAAYRTALQTLFTGTYGGTMNNSGGGTNVNGTSVANKMIYVNLSNAFPQASTSDFYSDYTAGYPNNTAIHPNPAGHAAIFAVVQPALAFAATQWSIF